MPSTCRQTCWWHHIRDNLGMGQSYVLKANRQFHHRSLPPNKSIFCNGTNVMMSLHCTHVTHSPHSWKAPPLLVQLGNCSSRLHILISLTQIAASKGRLCGITSCWPPSLNFAFSRQYPTPSRNFPIWQATLQFKLLLCCVLGEFTIHEICHRLPLVGDNPWQDSLGVKLLLEKILTVQ